VHNNLRSPASDHTTPEISGRRHTGPVGDLERLHKHMGEPGPDELAGIKPGIKLSEPQSSSAH
jgi:hypothetical protein